MTVRGFRGSCIGMPQGSTPTPLLVFLLATLGYGEWEGLEGFSAGLEQNFAMGFHAVAPLPIGHAGMECHINEMY